MRHRILPYVALPFVLTACTYYYLTSNLNTLAPGQTKADIQRRFPMKQGTFETTVGFELRAARVQQDGSLIEVGSLLLARDGINHPESYWLLFRDGKLVQWGQPDDWQTVSARYQIDFNPRPAVRSP